MNLTNSPVTTFKKRARLFVLAAALGLPLFAYTNCSSSHDSGSSASISDIDTGAILDTLRAEKNRILSSKCADCHNATTTDNDLRDILNTQYLIDGDYINSGSPQTSALYLRIVDGFMPPVDSADISDTELASLRDWIAAEGGNFDTYIGGNPVNPGGGGGTAVSFTQIRAILTQNCTNCHRAGGEPPRLDVDAATLRGTTHQGAPLVVPGNANASLLLQSFGSMAPGAPLGVNSPQGNAVRTWINGGAL